MPFEGETGKIQNIDSSKVLESQGKHSSVALSPPKNGSLQQMWTRGKTTSNGYFTLKNVQNVKYLTNHLMMMQVVGRTDYWTQTIVAGKYD